MIKSDRNGASEKNVWRSRVQQSFILVSAVHSEELCERLNDQPLIMTMPEIDA